MLVYCLRQLLTEDATVEGAALRTMDFPSSMSMGRSILPSWPCRTLYFSLSTLYPSDGPLLFITS